MDQNHTNKEFIVHGQSATANSKLVPAKAGIVNRRLVPAKEGIANQESLLLSCQDVISGEIKVEFDYFYAKQTQFPKSQMNVTPYNTMDYENKSNWTLGENKPNSKPIKPNFKIPDRIRFLSSSGNAYTPPKKKWLNMQKT